MNVLLDCGAYTGDSLPLLMKRFGPFDRMVCFEANPNLVVERPPGAACEPEVVRSAVWNQNTDLRFYLGEHNEQSSLMENKTSGNFTEERSLVVDAVDLCDWMEKNTAASDQIVIKMDIEGAEFDVLEKLVRHPVCARVKHLLVEWHNNRLKPRWVYRLRRRLLELRFRMHGIRIRIWGKRDFPELGNT